MDLNLAKATITSHLICLQKYRRQGKFEIPELSHFLADPPNDYTFNNYLKIFTAYNAYLGSPSVAVCKALISLHTQLERNEISACDRLMVFSTSTNGTPFQKVTRIMTSSMPIPCSAK